MLAGIVGMGCSVQGEGEGMSPRSSTYVRTGTLFEDFVGWFVVGLLLSCGRKEGRKEEKKSR